MSSAGCRPEVADRILQILMDDPDVRFLAPSALRPARPSEKPKKAKPPKPPRPAPPPKPPRPSAAQLQEEARARRRERARELFRAGHSLGAIAEELGVTAPTVAADVADLRVRQRRVCDPVALRARQEEHVRLFRDGWSVRQIAEHHSLTYAMVRRDLAACGIRTSEPAGEGTKERLASSVSA